MKKEQIKAMIGKAKNKVWLFLKKICKTAGKNESTYQEIKTKRKDKRGEYKGSDQAEEMPVLKVSPNRGWIRLFWVLLVNQHYLGNL